MRKLMLTSTAFLAYTVISTTQAHAEEPIGTNSVDETIEIISAEMPADKPEVKDSTPSSERPTTETATTETPSSELPAVEPSVETEEPVTESPTTEMPVTEAPVAAEPATVQPAPSTAPDVLTPEPSVVTPVPTNQEPSVAEPEISESATAARAVPYSNSIESTPVPSDELTTETLQPAPSDEMNVKPAQPVTTEEPVIPSVEASSEEQSSAEQVETPSSEIKEDKFQPESSEKFYKKLDKQVSEFLTADNKKIEHKEKAVKKSKKTEKMKMQILPDTGEHKPYLLMFTMLAGGLSLLILSRLKA